MPEDNLVLLFNESDQGKNQNQLYFGTHSLFLRYSDTHYNLKNLNYSGETFGVRPVQENIYSHSSLFQSRASFWFFCALHPHISTQTGSLSGGDRLARDACPSLESEIPVVSYSGQILLSPIRKTAHMDSPNAISHGTLCYTMRPF